MERVRADEGNEYTLKTLHLGFDPEVLAVEAENLRRVQHDNGLRMSTMAPTRSARIRPRGTSAREILRSQAAPAKLGDGLFGLSSVSRVVP